MSVSSGLFCTAWLVLVLGDLHVVANCSFHFASGQSKVGNFSSPSFPEFYPTGANCHYSFEGQEHEGVKLAFYVFDLEAPFRTGCLNDYVDISTITLHNVRHLVGRYCGHKPPSPLLSMHPKVEIDFRSNYAIQHKGFHGTYEFVDEKYVPPPTSTAAVEGCGGLISGVGGVITSPGYPDYFAGNLDCLWLIRVTYSKVVYVRILELQLHGSIATCNRAEVAVFDGYTSFTSNGHKIKSYCGDLKYYKNVDDRNVLSHRNRLIIRFTSGEQSKDKSLETDHVGFKLVWTEVSFEERALCSEFSCPKSEYCLESRPGSACLPTKLFCVDHTLVCNGVPNCSEGDNTDEEQCNSSYMVGIIAGASVGVFCLLIIGCICKRHVSVRKSTSQTQSLTMQLRQLDHSPSCSNRQISSSFSQPCDLLSPAVLEVNGTPGHGHYDMVITSSGVGGSSACAPNYTRYKSVPTDV